MINLSIKDFLTSVILRILLVATTSYFIAHYIQSMANSLSALYQFSIVCVSCVIVTSLSVILLGITDNERNMIIKYFLRIINRLAK